ncbi:MAG: nucleoside monophosphate kinase [Pseudomonadota bacterium]
MVIILIGPPGSGKGTQAEILAAELNLTHLSTGDVLRAMTESGTSEGAELKKMMSEGKLVPSDMVNKFVLASLEANNGNCILDGYPRNIDQAKFLSQNYFSKIQVIYFDLDKELLIKRITGRFSCKNCGKIYNKYFNSTKIESLCDACGDHEFLFRSDDNVVTIEKRLNEYKEETEPVIEYYKSQGFLIELKADAATNVIAAELLSTLKSH